MNYIETIGTLMAMVVLSFSLLLGVMILDNYLVYDVVFLHIEFIGSDFIQYDFDGNVIRKVR